MHSSITRNTLVAAAACALVSALPAQWVTFQNETASRLVAAAGLVETDPQEKDYAWADFDQDGDIDMVIVRKQPFTTGGHFPNVLLMNENGVLTDRTSTKGSASTVAGSSGMLDATNDRDVVCVDVNGDGWVDIVTATTLTAGNPQYIRVPRVYINQGSVLGVWQGFLYDDELRISDATFGTNGEHRFCSVAAGDIDGDGDMDLYFGDYQQGGSRSVDVDDRLLINDGFGYFTDESSTRMTFQMLESSFGMKVAMVDMNADGRLDILKDDALNSPQQVSISYNNLNGGSTHGIFNSYQNAYGNAPYHFNVNDLNNDGRPDIIVSDDGQDRYVLNTGVGVTGQATFGPTIAFSYVGGGSDDGFGGNNLIADLNGDGFKDAIIADVDVDISGYSRRCHIFHNLGNVPNVTMQEELIAGAVCGIPLADLQATFDVAVFDINGDGYNDMVIGRSTGTKIWINQPPIGLSFDYPGGQPALVAPGSIRTMDVHVTGIGGVTPVAGTGKVYTSINGAPFVMATMTDVGPGLYRTVLPAMPACSGNLRYYVTVDGSNAQTYTNPALGAAGATTVSSAVGTTLAYENNMEGPTTGWSVVNTSLTSGAWEVAVPNGTINLTQQAAPFEDGEQNTANVRCWVTQNGLPGGASGTADVDGGPTDLLTPPIDLFGTDGFISYRRWHYSTDAGDVLNVAVSPNGVTWTTVENVVPVPGITNVWTTFSFRVSDYIVPSPTTQVRFRSWDVSPGHIVESAIDLFRVEAFACTMCQETIAQGGPGTATYSVCGGDLSFGTTATMSILGTPPGATSFFTAGFFNFAQVWPAPGAGSGLILDTNFPLVLYLGPTDGLGNFVVPGFPPSGLGSFALFSQIIYVDPAQAQGFGFTDVVKLQFKP